MSPTPIASRREAGDVHRGEGMVTKPLWKMWRMLPYIPYDRLTRARAYVLVRMIFHILHSHVIRCLVMPQTAKIAVLSDVRERDFFFGRLRCKRPVPVFPLCASGRTTARSTGSAAHDRGDPATPALSRHSRPAFHHRKGPCSAQLSRHLRTSFRRRTGSC